jgi:TM2 domain-containing membrane protein YozV
LKKKFVAILLAIFLGSFGIHKFYLRQAELGIGYIAIFVWFGKILGFPFSAFLGWYDAYKLSIMDEVEFDRKYNSYFYRDRYGRRIEKLQRKQSKRTGRYVLLDEKEDKNGGYLTPINRLTEFLQYKRSGIKKFKDYDTKGAIEDFLKALSISKEDASIHFNIACAYSIEENAYMAFEHLDKAIANGFKDMDLILSHEALAYIRVMPEFELFIKNQYRVSYEWLDNLKNQNKESVLILKQEIPVIINKQSI